MPAAMRINMAMQILKRLEAGWIKIRAGLFAVLLCHPDDVGQPLGNKVADLLLFITRQDLLELRNAQISGAAHLTIVRFLGSGHKTKH